MRLAPFFLVVIPVLYGHPLLTRPYCALDTTTALQRTVGACVAMPGNEIRFNYLCGYRTLPTSERDEDALQCSFTFSSTSSSAVVPVAVRSRLQTTDDDYG